MEVILKKIADIEYQLSTLKDLIKDKALLSATASIPKGKKTCGQKSSGYEDWIEVLKRERGAWTSKPLVVLSLFDGIGGIWVALKLLGIPYIGYSAEVNPFAIKVLESRHPNVQHLGDVRGIHRGNISEEIDLVVGGFPCQDLSCLGKKAGLHGDRSKLFFEFLRILKVFKPKWFLAENVASMHWIDREEISKHIGVLPIEIDSQELSATKRKRYYWTNIPHPERIPNVMKHDSTRLQHVLENATALEEKLGCIVGQNPLGSHVTLQQVLKTDGKSVRSVNVKEVEKALGFPAGYTDVRFMGNEEQKPEPKQEVQQELNQEALRYGGRLRTRNEEIQSSNAIAKDGDQISELTRKGQTKVRWQLLGNSFSVRVIAYLLSPLLDLATRLTPSSIVLSKNIAEEKCSVMDVGEVWALYNMQQLPNWYAIIEKRSGDRFSPVQKGDKRLPLLIEVKFLELSTQYSSGEIDKWNPQRGAGSYHLGRTTDRQECWLSFSHRVTGFVKTRAGYFIYPVKGQVWALYQREERSSPWFVLVIESSIDHSKIESARPGQEGFKARCKILQLTVQADVFRVMEKEVLYEDILQFSFMVPYCYKNEGGLLKLEFSYKGRKLLSGKKRRHRGEEMEGFEDDIYEEEGDFIEEVNATDLLVCN
ncbi:hypothetical protein KP509_12G075700 [Ceratopteris richardii]|uniref:DNA (cytosine-5-)-methyltransferase n=1 Tax=Ceratopteris richardii TaxID=49495 RepID=A0A8T2TPW8_CERRI|nr:hypothetical protein KP509_12G075700 [Ceratopteris richardii]KAH7423822.1 hypothetical protein KP509_12G075700 [Ceratopteris richardii]KAH7423823.1 hypothetical protein KP509_12G075700 [Ceratopteris richardii]